MEVMIKHEDCDNAKVRAFGATLAADPMLAVALADALFRGSPFTGTAATVRTKFDRLSPWEQAGAVDELRDALDKHLEARFQRYMEIARQSDDAAKAQASAEVV